MVDSYDKAKIGFLYDVIIRAKKHVKKNANLKHNKKKW